MLHTSVFQSKNNLGMVLDGTSIHGIMVPLEANQYNCLCQVENHCLQIHV